MTDIVRRHHYEDGKFIFEGVQDVEPILDRNKALQNEPNRRGETFRKIGSIPAIILERWIAEDGVNYLGLNKREFDRLIRRRLRDPDWRWLRTSPGAI